MASMPKKCSLPCCGSPTDGLLCLPASPSPFSVALSEAKSQVDKKGKWTGSTTVRALGGGVVQLEPVLGGKGMELDKRLRDSPDPNTFPMVSHPFPGKAGRFYLSSEFCLNDKDTADRLKTHVKDGSNYELNASYKQKRSSIEFYCCQGRPARVGRHGKGKVFDKEDGLYAKNVKQGRKDVQPKADIEESGARAHKSNYSHPTDKSQVCLHKFTAKHDKDRSLWYITLGSGVADHNGHPQKVEHELRVDVETMDKEEIQVAKDMNEANASSRSVKRVVQKRTGKILTDDQMSNLMRRAKKDLVVGSDGGKLSAAEELLDWAKTNPNIEYMALIEGVDTPLFTENTTGKRFRKGRSQVFTTESSISGFKVGREAVPIQDDASDIPSANAAANAAPTSDKDSGKIGIVGGTVPSNKAPASIDPNDNAKSAPTPKGKSTDVEGRADVVPTI